jgi:hypothetical protein
MRKFVLPFTLLTVAAFSLPTTPARAQAPRTFVSASGSDSNPCSFAAPCRHFQAAVTATSAGGEVDALDPAGYGPITISQAITIEGQGWSYIAPPVGGNGININAVRGNVSIHGVSLNGAGITGGTNGIVFNSGGSLTVTNCVINNFTGTGILITPSSGSNQTVLIADSFALNNGANGIEIDPLATSTVSYTIDRTTVANNGTSSTTAGILVNAGGGFSFGTLSSVNADMNSVGVYLTGNEFVSDAYIRNSIIHHSSVGHDLMVLSTVESVLLFDSNQIDDIGNSGTIYSDRTNDISSLEGNPLILASRQ